MRRREVRCLPSRNRIHAPAIARIICNQRRPVTSGEKMSSWATGIPSSGDMGRMPVQPVNMEAFSSAGTRCTAASIISRPS
jgi:hypothetical protein